MSVFKSSPVPVSKYKYTRPRKHEPAQVLAYIREYKLAHDGNSPNLHEIQRACRIPSISNARRIVGELERDGIAEIKDGKLCLTNKGHVEAESRLFTFDLKSSNL